MNILIVGAGPAGLALANFLQPNKHSVTIIEKNANFTTAGFGIFIYNEGKKLLKTAVHNKEISTYLRDLGYKKYLKEDCSTFGSTHYNDMFHVNHYNSNTSIKREDLHTLLLKNLSHKVHLLMGTTIARLQNDYTGAKVTLSNGETKQFDLVVGADGFHSMLREQYFSYSIKNLPWTARYFWLNKTVDSFLLEWGNHATIMCMPHKKKSTILAIESNTRDFHSELVCPKLVAFYLSLGMTKSQITKVYKNSYTAPMRYVYTKKWYNNRVVLIGDAQHAMTPTMGLGTSLALDDAYSLALLINSYNNKDTLESLLIKFSKTRSRRIVILRLINRFADEVMFRSSKTYVNFWYKYSHILTKISQLADYSIRLGWKYTK